MNLQSLLKQKRTLIMGILNVSPDSFSGDGTESVGETVKKAEKMLSEGADILDIGGQSTRPGTAFISEKDELRRVLPPLIEIRRKLGNEFIISIDTSKSLIAEKTLQNGANMINSLDGFNYDINLASVIKKYNCPIIIYHIQGTPKTMQHQPTYKDVIAEIINFFTMQVNIGIKYRIRKNQFILDPGIGFGKTTSQNLTIVKYLHNFKKFDIPLLIGISRKSHLAMILQNELKLKNKLLPTESLSATLAETAIAIQNGAKIVRTHDVWETKKFITILDKFIYANI